MSRERDGVDPDVSELERALRALVPRSSQASHDRLLFAAGRASERNRAQSGRRLWMCAAGIPTVAAIVLALLLIEARDRASRLELALSESVPPAVDAVTEENTMRNTESTLVRPTNIAASTESTPTGESDSVPIVTGTTAPAHNAGSSPRGATSSVGMPRYLELRNRVLRLGVEALADRRRDTSGASSAAAPLTNRALRQMYLPSPDRPPAG